LERYDSVAVVCHSPRARLPHHDLILRVIVSCINELREHLKLLLCNAANLPAPAVGWPLFVVLGIVYFAMAYLLLGALFLTIGSMATSVREVQTLSMPVTMLQLMVFFLAAYTIKQPGSGLEMAAIAFPLSSPFAMLARAALEETLWPHALAVLWQGVAVILLVKGGSMLFRKRVMKSGGAGRDKKRKGLRLSA
jgi:ABC-2 type transport system permease protein